MNKIFSFMSGMLCGALVGGVTALFLTPASGDDLITAATDRWHAALEDAQAAMADTEKRLTEQFEQAKKGA